MLPDLAQREVSDGLPVPSDNRAEERHGATKKGDGGEWRILRGLLIWRGKKETRLGIRESETERREKLKGTLKDDCETVRWSSYGYIINNGNQSYVFDTFDEFAQYRL